PETLASAMLDGVRDLGLRLSGAAARLATRVEMLRAEGHDLPDFSETGLLDSLEDWLLPMLSGVRSANDWKSFDLLPALRAALSWEQTQLLDREVPGSFVTPLGRKIPIDYDGDLPGIEVRLQEMFGVTRHPTVAGVALKVTLLSPARRPIQITRDLPGFWAGSYADVRKDMRAQYPKHPWPEDPTQAEATLRARRKG
ncbi:ATP-dependent helicase C-terminal domain-containing protein, partial [Phaeobacter sp. HF9A]|uniref:ATP-dependent helicase C-terminal domain-containing protein n=1 Tax=Phaeobacter sp. HF9A TaxID=2721561 RepID=UPI001F8768EB